MKPLIEQYSITEARREEICSETIPGNGIESQPGELQSQATVRTDEGTTTGTFSANGYGQLNSTIPQPDNGGLLQNGAPTDGQRPERSRSLGNRMAAADGKSWPALSSLENYHNTKGFDKGRSFSKTNAFKANLTALQLLHDTLNRTIPILETLPRDKGDLKFEAFVNEKAFDKVGEFGKAMIRETLYQAKYKNHGHRLELGSLWGFKIVGTIEHSWGEKHVIRQQVLSPDGEKNRNGK